MIIFMSIALIVVIGLLIMVFSEHASMKKYDSKKAELLEKIEKIFKQKYAPVSVNVSRIESDIVEYKKQAKKLEAQFGHPYAPALKSFAEAVDIPLDKFRTKFSEFWENQKGRTTRDLIFRRYKVRQFGEDFPKHKATWDTAMKAFMREAQKVTLEEIDVSNVDGIFLAALGKGRRFSDSPQRCQAFMKRMRFRMIDYLASKKVECAATDFSFQHEREPSSGDIERIARAWDIVSDLIKRIADAKVNPKEDKLELENFSKRGLDGQKDGNYTLYRFSFTAVGDLATIRRIGKKLYEAYKDNRIYAVRNISLSRTTDNVNDILAESERLKLEVDYDNSPDKEAKGEKRLLNGENTGILPRLDKTRSALPPTKRTDNNLKIRKPPVEKEKKKILGPKDSGYARVIVGSNNLCRAGFEVDYIVFED